MPVGKRPQLAHALEFRDFSCSDFGPPRGPSPPQVSAPNSKELPAPRTGATTPLGSPLRTAEGKKVPVGKAITTSTRLGVQRFLLQRFRSSPGPIASSSFSSQLQRITRPTNGSGVAPRVPRFRYRIRENARHLQNGSESRREACCGWGPCPDPPPPP